MKLFDRVNDDCYVRNFFSTNVKIIQMYSNLDGSILNGYFVDRIVMKHKQKDHNEYIRH